jgi:hypothetical protein
MAILATFYGLAAGLTQIQMGGSDELVKNVNGLLSGMSLAFMNSLWGIGCSLLWAFLHAIVEGWGRMNTQGFSQTVRECLPSWEPDELNAFLVEQQVKQTANMQSIGTDFAIEIRRALDEIMELRVSKPLQSLQGSLNAQTDRMTSVQEEGLKQIAGSLVEQMHGAAGKEINALATAVAEFRFLLVSSQESYTIVLENLERAAGGLWPVVDKFEALSANLDGYTAEIRRMQEVSAAGAEQTAAVVQQMQNAATELGGLYRQIQEGQSSIEGQIRQISQAWDSTDSQLSNLAGKVERAANHFSSDFVTSLKQVHGQIDELLSTSLSHFSGTLANLDEMMRSDVLKVLAGLKESTQQTDALLRESLAEAPRALAELASLSKSLSTTLHAMQPMLSQLEVLARSSAAASRSDASSSPQRTASNGEVN